MILLVNGHGPPVHEMMPGHESVHIVTTGEMRSVHLVTPRRASLWVILDSPQQEVLDQILNLITTYCKCWDSVSHCYRHLTWLQGCSPK